MANPWDNAERVVNGQPSGGAISDGQEIAFGLKTAEKDHWFKLDHSMLHQLIHGLLGFWKDRQSWLVRRIR